MPLETKLVTFPAGKVSVKDTTPASQADELITKAYHADITEICTGTRAALQELRHGVQYMLFDLLDKLGMDTMTMCRVLDEKPSVVTRLRDRDVESLTTENLIQIVELLQKSL